MVGILKRQLLRLKIILFRLIDESLIISRMSVAIFKRIEKTRIILFADSFSF